MGVSTMSPATIILIIQLLLADTDNLLKRPSDMDELIDSDERTSLEALRQDLRRQLPAVENHALAVSILQEENNNRIVFARLLEEERQAVTDHQLAMQLAGLPTTDPRIEQSKQRENELAGTANGGIAETLTHSKQVNALFAASVEATAVDKSRGKDCCMRLRPETHLECSSIQTRKCCACMESVLGKNALDLGCKPVAHTYCHSCLVDLFKSALVNTSLFPPRCCRIPIPLDECRAILPQELFKDFDLKVEELATPNPSYCSNAECSKFIQAKNIKADIGTCVFCKHKTCVRCKCATHKALCLKDPHVQLLLNIAKRSKWQQCTKCNNMVELATGCFHMTCRCRHEFCYLCGKAWKLCTCPQWDEGYLTHPIVGIPAAGGVPGPAPALHHVHNWRRVDGPDCQECGADYLDFIMRCEGCNQDNCWRCIDNRE